MAQEKTGLCKGKQRLAKETFTLLSTLRERYVKDPEPGKEMS